MVPLQFRIQGFLLGAALGELYGTGLLDAATILPSTATASIQLPHTQHLLQTIRVGLQKPDIPWMFMVTQPQDWALFLNAAVLALLYPGSPQQLVADWNAIAPPNGSKPLQTAIALSYGVAVALNTPITFPTLQQQALPFHPAPWLETVYRSVWRAPMDYRASLQLTQQQLPENSLALTLTGALSGSLNTITDFPLLWLATLTELPCPMLGEPSWLETLQSLSDHCLARWSGKLQALTGETIGLHHWSTVAIAPANQFRPR
jgi:hypothetical protein